MDGADVDEAARVSATAFGVDISDTRSAGRWRQRVSHLLDTDPDGAFVAERGGRVIGAAQAMRRERLWCLSLLAVQDAARSSGAGRALLAAALDYDHGTDAGLIVSSNDPRALALYARSGFRLRPTLQATGPVDRRALPSRPDEVRAAGRDDLAALADISRSIRGAPHTVEIEYALGRGAEIVQIEGRGFAVAKPGHGVWLLVARDEPAASALLWSALEIAGDSERVVRWITAGQDWAVQIAVAAGLRLGAYGALAVRGEPGPMRPFLPSSPFA
jgi:predicted N-acetyltransferase YhbS